MGEAPALRYKYEGVMGEAPALKFKFEYSKGCVEDSMIVEMLRMSWHGDSAAITTLNAFFSFATQ